MPTSTHSVSLGGASLLHQWPDCHCSLDSRHLGYDAYVHEVAVLARNGVVPFDLAVPVEVFGRTRLVDGSAPYRVRVCAPTPHVDAGPFAVRVQFGLEALAEADTVVLPGVADPFGPVPEPVVAALQAAHARGARLASTCVGAFTLAATGLLDGLTATTHWLAADDLARLYPAVRVDAHVLFVDHGRLLTSAGAAAGLDLCLHMVRRDFGAAVAADAARASVMPLEREGGQAQFIAHPPPNPDGSTLAPLLANEAVEVFAVACLSTKHRLLAWHVLSRGTRSSTSISLPDVFVPACLTPGTTALLVVHNHPSGDPSPSAEDLRITADLAEAGRLLDIELLDHLVIGRDRWVSLRAAGAV